MAWNDVLEMNPKFAGANYTPKEVAERLGINVVNVYHYIDIDELVALNIGRGSKRARWIIAEEDAEDFIKRYNERKAVVESAKEVEEVPAIEETKKKDAVNKEALLRKVYYIKEAMLDLSVRLEELEKELEEEF